MSHPAPRPDRRTSPQPTADPARIDRFPRAVRAPYDVADPSLDYLYGSDTERWRHARRADRTAALHEPLDGLALSDYESHILRHIAEGSDTDVVAVLNRVLHLARGAAPLGAHTGGACQSAAADGWTCALPGGHDVHLSQSTLAAATARKVVEFPCECDTRTPGECRLCREREARR